jgi:molybdopterin converting factor small subunit
MIRVRVPASLRVYTGGSAVIEIDLDPGADVADLLAGVARDYPDLERRLRDEQGRLRPHVNVFVGTDNIRDLGGLATVVPDAAEVSVLPAVSGGGCVANRLR